MKQLMDLTSADGTHDQGNHVVSLLRGRTVTCIADHLWPVHWPMPVVGQEDFQEIAHDYDHREDRKADHVKRQLEEQQIELLAVDRSCDACGTECEE